MADLWAGRSPARRRLKLRSVEGSAPVIGVAGGSGDCRSASCSRTSPSNPADATYFGLGFRVKHYISAVWKQTPSCLSL